MLARTPAVILSGRRRPLDKLTAWFLAVLFGFASLDKIAHYHGFVTAINSYQIIFIPLGHYLAPLVIASELSISIGLVKGTWRRLAALQAAVLMTLFTVGLAGNRLLGGESICGCWFSVTMAQGDRHFILNAIIIAMSLLLWRAERRRSLH